MHTSIFLTLLTPAIAIPLTNPSCLPTNPNPNWLPAANTTVTCDKTSDKIISFYVGPQIETVLNDACAAMMPPCAYQDRVSPDTMCIQTIDWKLSDAKSSVQNANVEDAKTANKLSGWAVKCE
ncbi:hypothetical protein K505DRAFT_380514 [Melanomma pulvis-pyrius CBS 109.77]|uniref:Uncharacterized protein n=1 Tax=Melanomma pulvis-pyrius CBS 109.77 TaxID=1314802 RepID=A0A6A6WPM4_9PLEO|nr:hypothetical protein K505DRAFT_380514 [Melanomma pulvis-pyrius CBS 109.77]